MKEVSEEKLLLLKIIDNSLSFENFISYVLNLIFSVNNPENTKSFKKNGTLSVKNKIDFLFDFELINKEEYLLFLLQIEIRNRFVHDIEITTLEKCIDSFKDNTQKNRFLKIHESESYLVKFEELYAKNIECITKIITENTELISKRGNYINTLTKCINDNSHLTSVLLSDILNILIEKNISKDLILQIVFKSDDLIQKLNENKKNSILMTESNFQDLILGKVKET